MTKTIICSAILLETAISVPSYVIKYCYYIVKLLSNALVAFLKV